MSEKGKDGTTPPPFTFNSSGTFSVGAAPAGQEDLATNAPTSQLGNLSLAPKVGEEEDEFPAAVINRLVGLKQLQEEYDNLEDQYKSERIALEKKYFELRTPLLNKRADVVVGKVDVEVEAADGVSTPASSDTKGIPGFWLQAIANHPMLSSLLGEQDGPALEALTNIKLEYSDDYTGFKLSFHFAPNDYFSNDVLTKSYTVSPDLIDDTAPALTSVDGTEITWKEKKNLCQTETKKKQKSKKGGQTRYVTQVLPTRSFFHYFADPHMGDEDEEEEEGEESLKAHEFQLSVDADYEIGHTFRSEIIPAAVLWFTGEADEGIDIDEDEDDEEGEDEGEEDEDGDDEDPAEESEEVGEHSKKVHKGHKGTAGTGGAGGAAGEQPECKQS